MTEEFEPKYVYIDVETTGCDTKNCGIIQLGVIIQIGPKVKEAFFFKVKPKKDALVEPDALKVNGVTDEQISKYEDMEEVFKKFKIKLNTHINPFDKKDKAFFVGYNCLSFDCNFIRQWFTDNGANQYAYGSYFWSNPIDVMVLAAEYLKHVRPQMENFKLKTVAKALDVTVDEKLLHNALGDIVLTKKIYDKLTN